MRDSSVSSFTSTTVNYASKFSFRPWTDDCWWINSCSYRNKANFKGVSSQLNSIQWLFSALFTFSFFFLFLNGQSSFHWMNYSNGWWKNVPGAGGLGQCSKEKYNGTFQVFWQHKSAVLSNQFQLFLPETSKRLCQWRPWNAINRSAKLDQPWATKAFKIDFISRKVFEHQSVSTQTSANRKINMGQKKYENTDQVEQTCVLICTTPNGDKINFTTVNMDLFGSSNSTFCTLNHNDPSVSMWCLSPR